MRKVALFIICLMTISSIEARPKEFSPSLSVEKVGKTKNTVYPYAGVMLVAPMVGASFRPEVVGDGVDMSFSLGGIPGFMIPLATVDARMLKPMSENSKSYIGYGLGAGLFDGEPFVYGILCIGKQSERGFLDLGIDLGYVDMPIPVLRAGFRF